MVYRLDYELRIVTNISCSRTRQVHYTFIILSVAVFSLHCIRLPYFNVQSIFSRFILLFTPHVRWKLLFITNYFTNYGVCSILLCWIKDFFTCRLQAVVFGPYISSYYNVNSNVFQESLYYLVNGIATSTDNSVSVQLLVDDAKLYTVIYDAFSCDKLRISLDNVNSWSNYW